MAGETVDDGGHQHDGQAIEREAPGQDLMQPTQADQRHYPNGWR